MLGIGLLLSACTQAPKTAAFANKAALKAHNPSSNVERLETWRDAKRLADTSDEQVVLVGQGESMAPLFGDNTILVINEIDFDKLEPGMDVAYLNKQGRRVVHRLKAQDAIGNWIVQGINNDAEDESRVTRSNLMGVVYASFVHEDALEEL